jgi:hypothetical protein
MCVVIVVGGMWTNFSLQDQVPADRKGKAELRLARSMRNCPAHRISFLIALSEVPRTLVGYYMPHRNGNI